MKVTLQILLALGLTFFATQTFAQPYVKFEGDPPMEIELKGQVIKGVKVKYNVPTSGYMYVGLKKDGDPIANAIEPVTRGKRIVTCNLKVFQLKEITKKGEYEYIITIIKEKGDWDNVIARATPVKGVKVVKKKKG